MKLSCTKENLNQGLAITSHVSTKNVNLPILSNVLLKADAGGLKLISTNLEIAITCAVRGKLEQQGEYTVPSKLFYDFVNLLPNDQVDIDLHDDGLSIACASAKTKIKGASAQEFPLVPPVSGTATYKINARAFAAALSQVLFATATNEARPELTGVLLSFTERDVVLAATDSYRLAEARVKLSRESKDKKREVIVPQRTLGELARVFSVFKDDVEAPENVDVELSDNQIVFRFGSVELISRTIEGAYPDYKQIIPERSNTEIVVDRAELIQGIKSASLFAKTGLFDIHLKVDPANNGLVLSANDATRGENKVEVAGEMTGGANEITMNYRYLIDGLQAMNSKKVVVKVIDAANPCVLLPHESDQEYQYIVMPIRQ